MQIGKYNCSLKRSGIIEIMFHPDFTLPDKKPVRKFFILEAKRTHRKQPTGIEFIR